MDDREIELSNPPFLRNSSTSNNNHYKYNTLGGGFDEIVKNTKTCTHTHTCNPPGPNVAHTHTCYHTHTQVFASEEDTKSHCNTISLKPKTPFSNREAVRKYREKKKAHTAFLEEEVKKLRVLNDRLVRKLQGQAALQAEISSLRALLADLGGKIDAKLGSFPFEKHCSANSGLSFEEGKAIGLQCPVENPCLGRNLSTGGGVEKPAFSWQENCQPAIVDRPLKIMESLGSAKNKGQKL